MSLQWTSAAQRMEIIVWEIGEEKQDTNQKNL